MQNLMYGIPHPAGAEFGMTIVSDGEKGNPKNNKTYFYVK